MAIGITEEHEELRQGVRRFVETNIPPAAARTVVDSGTDSRPAFWAALSEPGWLGLHVSEAHGGAGYGLVEQAVVIEELGRAIAPGSVSRNCDHRRDPRGRGWPRGRGVAPEARGRREHRRGRARAAPARCSVRTTPTWSCARSTVTGTRSTQLTCTRKSCRASTSAGTSQSSTSPVCSRTRVADSPGSRPSACAISPRYCSQPKQSVSRNGVWRPRPSTRRCACSSGGRSASSKA